MVPFLHKRHLFVEDSQFMRLVFSIFDNRKDVGRKAAQKPDQAAQEREHGFFPSWLVMVL
jgi:hypothetical protein